ncbi:MAG: transposase [Patescibacteria group bacterium]
MARPLRIEYPGAVYHVTSRGNRKGSIFESSKDNELFLKYFSYVIKDHNWLCHAYCLMPNHYHLLIETPDGNLSAGMRDLNGNYSQGYNKNHKTVGHLFQGRYKAFLIEKEPYLLNVAQYIVLNPVRANLAKHPREWKWSSYKATAGDSKKESWLSINWILSYFSKKKDYAQKLYKDSIMSVVLDESPLSKVKHGAILGYQPFIDWVWNNVTKGSESISEITREDRILGRPTLKELFKEVSSKKHRNGLIYRAKVRCGYSITDISKHLGLSRVTVSRILNDYKLK